MLGELENELIAMLKTSELGKRLKMIGSQPDVPDKDLIARWGLEAPAAYVACGDGKLTDRGTVATSFVVVLVARNARGHEAARHGDGRTIGLYEMVDASIALFNEAPRVGGQWYVTDYQFLQLTDLRDRGLYVALVSLHTQGAVPTQSTTDLADFDHLYANWKVVLDAEQESKPLAEAFIYLNPEEKP
jgi:phage gp37-like protein